MSVVFVSVFKRGGAFFSRSFARIVGWDRPLVGSGVTNLVILKETTAGEFRVYRASTRLL